MLIDVPEWRRDILEEHLEELEALWGRRARAIRSPVADAVALRRIDARMDAHADALALAGDSVWFALEPALSGDEEARAAAAALALAGTDDAGADGVLTTALTGAPPERRATIAEALALRASPRLRRALPLDRGASGEVVATTLAVLAAHGDPLPPRRHWDLVAHQAPAVRAAGWRIEARLGPRTRQDGERLGEREYEPALADPSPEVRRGALEAAARTAQPWLMRHLRTKARRSSAEALDEHVLLAALSTTADIPLVMALGTDIALGWERFRMLALLGCAVAVEALVRTMEGGSPVDAALAGAAFHRITGIDVERAERIPVVAPGDKDDAPSDEIRACDVEKARAAWGTLAERFGPAGRWARGADIAGLAPEALPGGLDLEMRWAAQVRHAHTAKIAVTLDHERFPFA